MKRLIRILITTALFASPAFAHDPKLHKGPKVEGKVVSLKGDRLEVGTTKGGTVAVYLTDETKYEQGADGSKAARSALREGQHVMVSGHKLASGKFAASEVMIRADADGASEPHGH
jgi:cytochrome c-type biogenesis protein CcmE